MRMTPRYYQTDATVAAVNWMRKSLDPCLIEAGCGAGKSVILAMIAEAMHKLTGGKHILVLAPTSNLVVQNHEKFLTTGEPASIYSASAGRKDLRHPVVYGTPGTVVSVASQIGSRIGVVAIDECEGMTPTIRKIIDLIRAKNQNVRVVGLTATPYVTGGGYVYRQEEDGRPLPEDQAKDPYFMRRIYCIGTGELVQKGFLTKPRIGAIGVVGYDTSGISVEMSKVELDQAIDRAFVGHNRKTAHIVADVVHQSKGRRGVMFFATSIQHAEEIMASLPPELSCVVHGKLPKKTKDKNILDFKEQRKKYCVNVSMLTVGADFPHADVIAILRWTESLRLLMQIVGRGARLYEGKEDFLILDYAENIDRHAPDGDIFKPQVKASFSGTPGSPIMVECPDCSIENEFTCRKNNEGHAIDKQGYFVDLAGDRVMIATAELDSAGQVIKLPMPAHFGRRCQAFHPARDGHSYQCGYRWSSKECPHCQADNDIAARYCTSCRGEIIDPASKLRIEFKQMKKDPTILQTDEVLNADATRCLSTKGNPQIKVTYTTPFRSFTVYYQTDPKSDAAARETRRYLDATDNMQNPPDTITYRKESSGFFRVHSYNLPADVCEAID